MASEVLVASGHPHLHWFADPLVLVPLCLFAGIYIWRFAQARKEVLARGGSPAKRGVGPLQALAFAGGMLALLAALVSPLDGLGEDYLFSAHMVQHVLLGDVAPLLILLSALARDHAARHAAADARRAPRSARSRSPAACIVLWLALDVRLAHPGAVRRRRSSTRSSTCSSTSRSSPPAWRSGGR